MGCNFCSDVLGVADSDSKNDFCFCREIFSINFTARDLIAKVSLSIISVCNLSCVIVELISDKAIPQCSANRFRSATLISFMFDSIAAINLSIKVLLVIFVAAFRNSSVSNNGKKLLKLLHGINDNVCVPSLPNGINMASVISGCWSWLIAVRLANAQP